MDTLCFMLLSANLLLSFCDFSNAIDNITVSQSISDGTSRTLVSSGGDFELGFFSPGSSSNRYVGIWYKNIPVRTVVWVANRGNPINDSSGMLMIDSSTGNLVLVSKNRSVVWSTNATKLSRNSMVQLLDSGNLVLRDENPGNYLWQSFDFPTDTLLPGMKLGVNLKTGLDRHLTAWKNWDDPSPGDFVWRILVHNNPEATIWNGSSIYIRSGPWNGITFSGVPQLKPNSIYDYKFVATEEEVYYAYYLRAKTEFSRLVMNQTTSRRNRYTWNKETQSWTLYSYVPVDYCDAYELCGAYGNCVVTDSPVCKCLDGFKPKSVGNWNSADWSQGCVRNKSLKCGNGDGFMKFSGLKLPDTTYSWENRSMTLNECRDKCLQNCSCTAYTNLDIRGGGSGCAIWFHDLIDIRQYPVGGQELYVRVSASELGNIKNVKFEPDKKIIVIVVTVIAVVSGMLITSYYYCKIRTRALKENDDDHDKNNKNGPEEDLEQPLFDLATITNATNDFSFKNKLGEGGFGPVFKGTLVDGQEIAVKRLSRNSEQGLNEFKNEVILIAKLQHRNLVKLLGCCTEGEERMLIYEYMPNGSLYSFIFDQRRGKLLDWYKRLNIIRGIARGLLYLHQDSRLRIIHRDLKASNVLLDDEMNPKISDFGMAKTFGGDQIEGNTNRVVGTYGYMAPEYATDGLFSVKSDVFSFGIIMLEIISGRKSRGFYHPDDSLNLIGFAWGLWKEGKPLELVDTLLGESCNLSEVTRCIHISLLCVQQHPDDRPSMASVVLMLGSEIPLPQPKEPGFFKDNCELETEFSSCKFSSYTTGDVTISMLEPQ